jgi:2-amino-4-hydroxy-6-hydroxymethyldihydropteridine diphosphokinase
VLRDRRPHDGSLRRRRRHGQGDQARAADRAAGRRGNRRGLEGARGLKAWLGLGSNVGDRLANLRAARSALGERGAAVTASSAVYETEAQDGAVGQDDFLNACVSVETDLEPEQLLAVAKRIELELGRDPAAPRHAPRPVDIDLLLIEGREHASERLTVPHAEVLNRRFVLEPLLELDPPGREGLEQALEGTADQRVTIIRTCF